MRYDYRKSYKKKKEEIVARHLKEEESINPSLDQDPNQDTDRFHTIEKDQTGVKEEGQDPQGIRDSQGQCHVQYLQEGVQKYVPKQNPLGIRDGQGHRHVQYLPRRHSKVRSKTRSPRNNRHSRSLSRSLHPRSHSKGRSKTRSPRNYTRSRSVSRSISPRRHLKLRSRTRSRTPIKHQKRSSRSSRSNLPYYDHRTPRDLLPIMHRDNAEMLNNPKHVSIPERRCSRSRSRPLGVPKYSLERLSKSRSRSQSRSTLPTLDRTPKKVWILVKIWIQV